jgi:aryl-alcohol dehydrogenase-like predicted oxidoreductase
MRRTSPEPSRRAVLASLAALGAAGAAARPVLGAAPGPMLKRAIPSTGEQVPVIGMGSWITFNVGDDPALREQRTRVLAAFFAAGGRVIDSSPMYGSSEAVIGHGLARLGRQRTVFAATKVWTPLAALGPGQMARSRELWGVGRLDLVQVHNLLRWEGHLETLLADKAAGRIRHVGVTTSHGSRHELLEQVMRTQPIDAVQLTYNVLDREAEVRLLPLAAERGLAVLVNRPFRQGELLERLRGEALPAWAGEIGCTGWAQLLLKFVVAHPAVTCAIPATSRVDHMRENMGALRGRLPDRELRARLVRHVASL